MQSKRGFTGAIVAMLAFAMLGLTGSAEATTGCATDVGTHPGGEWPSMNHDLSNTRNQDQEAVIGADNVADLEPAWVRSSVDWDGEGIFQSTPVIADGCIYVASGTSGLVFAANADTGEFVWTHQLPGGALGLTVEPGDEPGEGLVHANSFAPGDLRANAINQKDGTLAWSTPPLTDPERPQDGSVIHHSPVIWDGMAFVSVSRGVGDDARAPMVILDTENGTPLVGPFLPIPEEDLEQGFTGAGAWSTAAVDAEEGFLYVATADPDSFTSEHRYSNAILKIDFRRDSPTLGDIVDAYRGRSESFVDVPGQYTNPACQAEPELITLASSSITCLQLDYDFGASVNLFENSFGHKVVGALQKSGTYHAAYADNMQRAWTVDMSPTPFGVGNATTAAYDGQKLYAGVNPGNVVALDKDFDLPHWVSNTLGDAVKYQPMTYANGVVYTLTATGSLVAMDADTGATLLHRPLSADLGGQCSTEGGGVAVARNTVYAQCDSGPDGGSIVALTIPGAY